MRISVVVPVKDDERLGHCIESIHAEVPAGQSVQVVVADNGSGEAFEPLLVRMKDCPGVDVVAARGTVYAARNRGVEASDGEVIFFTDADCVVDAGWFRAGLAALAEGLDVAQGFSGSSGDTRRDRLIQGRYEAQFKQIRPGAAVECDTRNLAVRRAVLDRVPFNEAYRRVGDTEFGLTAEALGFRVGYAPAMRVLHAHDGALDLFVAKQVCHGWGAQRLMRERPGLPWHGGHLRLTARFGPRISRLPGRLVVGRALARGCITAARLLDRASSRAPFALSLRTLGLLDKAAGLAGHLMYRAADAEPSPSQLLGRRLPRD